jgi:hypothetical protein
MAFLRLPAGLHSESSRNSRARQAAGKRWLWRYSYRSRCGSLRGYLSICHSSPMHLHICHPSIPEPTYLPFSYMWQAMSSIPAWICMGKDQNALTLSFISQRNQWPLLPCSLY